MSESKQQWTPGPWTYSRWDEPDTRFYIAQQEGAPYTPDYSDVATLVAETCSGERVARQEANAKLIAAAPELVEALEEAAEFLTLRSCPSALMDKINRALAKATEEQS